MARLSFAAGLFLLLAVSGCDEPPFDSSRSVDMSPNWDATKALTTQCARASIDISGTTVPEGPEISLLENALGKVLADKLNKLPSLGLQLLPRAYYRQYAGVLIDGKRFIYINGFHENYVRMSTTPSEWRIQPIVVCGGGAWYFGALYDPEQRKISQFSFNHE